jgi:hypothetical protein
MKKEAEIDQERARHWDGEIMTSVCNRWYDNGMNRSIWYSFIQVFARDTGLILIGVEFMLLAVLLLFRTAGIHASGTGTHPPLSQSGRIKQGV